MVLLYNKKHHWSIPMRIQFGWVWLSSEGWLYHIYLGKLGSTPDRIAKKCALNIGIDLSDTFLICTFGGTSWYIEPQYFTIVFLKSALTSLSKIWTSTWWTLLANPCMMDFYALILCLSLLLTKGACRIVLESQWYAIIMYSFPLLDWIGNLPQPPV